MSSKDVYETSGNRSKNLKCLKLYIMVPCFLEPKLVHIRCEHWDAKKKILLKLKERAMQLLEFRRMDTSKQIIIIK